MIRQGDIFKYQDHYCVCLSHTNLSRYSNTIIVCPILKDVIKYPLYYPIETYKVSGCLLIDQLRAIEFSNIHSMIIDSLSDEDISNVLALSKCLFDNERDNPSFVYVRVSLEEGKYYLNQYQDKPRVLLLKKEISESVYLKYYTKKEYVW